MRRCCENEFFQGQFFWGHSQQLTCLLLPHLAWVHLLVKIDRHCQQILFVKCFVPFLLCQLLFLTSRFVFRFFLSLYLNIYLVAWCIVDYGECLTNVQAPDFKESSHNTHSLILISEPRKSSVSYTTNFSQDEAESFLEDTKIDISI